MSTAPTREELEMFLQNAMELYAYWSDNADNACEAKLLASVQVESLRAQLAALDSTPPESPAPCPVCAEVKQGLDDLLIGAGGHISITMRERLWEIRAKAAEGCGK